jgi:hypothetical protein
MVTLIRLILLAGIIFLCSKSCQITFEGTDGSKIRIHKTDFTSDGNEKI